MHMAEMIFPYISYPLIPVQFCCGERKTPVIEALIDSGGDSIVIPRAIAQYLGSKMEETDGAKTAGGVTTLSKTRLDMIIGDGKAVYEDIDVFIVDSDDIPVLLGRTPLFDDYEITFNKKKSKIILKEV